MIIKEHGVNKKDNFICGYYSNRVDICRNIINYFENSDKKHVGLTDKGYDPFTKDSTDCVLEGDLLIEYVNEILNKCTDMYIKKYPYVNAFSAWTILEPVNIQVYNPNTAFWGWHAERTDCSPISGNRNLVFMTYLNDIASEGGQTEFLYQKIKVKPKAGLTLLWPPDWTHTHRGLPAVSETKYIVTGWFNYFNK